MKTFLTEKHNIPEGATHCGIFGCDTDVYFKLDGGVFLQWKDENWSLSTFNHHGWVKPIPQTKEVEWNGEGLPPVGEVVYGRFINPSHTDGEWLIHYISKDVGVYSIAGYECQYTFATESVLLSKIRCEDSEQELESAYELYSVCSESSGLDYDDFIAGVHATELNQWLSVVRKTGYRLEKCK